MCRGRSLKLQRALTDFGADESFAKAAAKFKEHYGVTVPSSTTRLDVQKHARKMNMNEKNNHYRSRAPYADCVIGQMDGSMIPIVSQKKTTEHFLDKRKNKYLEWKEVRLGVACPQGSDTAFYTAAIGSTDDAGQRLDRIAKLAGKKSSSKVHCVGDGAPWIAEQVEKLFGSQATFTIDFYHVSQYLADAARCCSLNPPKEGRVPNGSMNSKNFLKKDFLILS